MKLFNTAVSILILGLRPLLGPAQCRYEISCGNYALKQLQEKSLVPAVWAISKRLLSCNPFV